MTALAAQPGGVAAEAGTLPLVALVGAPNVGKSALFNRLTGRYVVVSNYPGTTVELAEGECPLPGGAVRLLDTPGMHSLVAITEEERVSARLLLERRPQLVLHVVDAKNLERSLPLCLQLLELGLPVVLVCNLMDEAEREGLELDLTALSRSLGIPVLGTVAVSGRGLEELRACLGAPPLPPAGAEPCITYPAALESAAGEVQRLLPAGLPVAGRGLALLLLQGEETASASWLAATAEPDGRIQQLLASQDASTPAGYTIAVTRHARASELCARFVQRRRGSAPSLSARLGELALHPWLGLPILLAVIYLGLYQFVGVFGAGTLVNLLEKDLFGELLLPPFNQLLHSYLPGESGWRYWARELVGGEYGMITLGLTYAVAIVLPIVGLFFLFFSVLEDTGYLPRLALLLDGAFKRLGLNGRAVIPLVLGFGCGTMATMVTRVQETARERLITTLLLALAVPCAAQYGVITALLARQPAGLLGVSYAWLAWAIILLGIFVLAGVLAARLLPGQPATFHMVLPPLRWPSPANLAVKTAARMKWYFLEVLPLFLLASALIWVGRLTGIFDLLIAGLQPLVALLGLPASTAPALLYGFFRRDFGAAGLYQLSSQGALSAGQLLVACVTLTLFLPCIAQFLIMKKERGLRTASAVAAGVFCFAFVVGGLLGAALRAAGVS